MKNCFTSCFAKLMGNRVYEKFEDYPEAVEEIEKMRTQLDNLFNGQVESLTLGQLIRLKKIINIGQRDLNYDHIPYNVPVPVPSRATWDFDLHKEIGLKYAFKIENEPNLRAAADDDHVMDNYDTASISPNYVPKYFWAVDHDLRSLVLTIRGSQTTEDFAIDIIGSSIPFHDGFAHRGIHAGAMAILADIEPRLEAVVARHPGYEFIINGHSLGAGTAILIGIAIMADKELMRGISRCRVIAFAPPPVYRPVFPLADYIDRHIEVYINRRDSIPRLSTATVIRLAATFRAVDEMNLGFFTRKWIEWGWAAKSILPKMRRRHAELLEVIRTTVGPTPASGSDDRGYFELPGIINYFFDVNNVQYFSRDLLKSADFAHAFFVHDKVWVITEAKVDSRFWQDHHAASYIKALEEADKTIPA